MEDNNRNQLDMLVEALADEGVNAEVVEPTGLPQVRVRQDTDMIDFRQMRATALKAITERLTAAEELRRKKELELRPLRDMADELLSLKHAIARLNHLDNAKRGIICRLIAAHGEPVKFSRSDSQHATGLMHDGYVVRVRPGWYALQEQFYSALNVRPEVDVHQDAAWDEYIQKKVSGGAGKSREVIDVASDFGRRPTVRQLIDDEPEVDMRHPSFIVNGPDEQEGDTDG
jgi:hypothetical protein